MDLGWLSAGLGAGIAVIGAGLGIGKLAASALEAMGRQPEAAGPIRTNMIIAAALIEGIAFFALVICILLAVKS
ncbi:MAG: ATP synthase F0 subunit C [Ignavibacteria bacterium GWA2_35_9]|nr:MAG: ATP synthase F0 subunit C [Ignavibacteria bacterium GWA2_35_9]OGU42875.1 MAG: ATP synthase F0 subunit C [Ignavibacteria bacterium GWB2_36_8]OGU48122.1 MAG: ATP synthase F0 subunit C [Ignavibacteria bacterium GWC2_36_12]